MTSVVDGNFVVIGTNRPAVFVETQERHVLQRLPVSHVAQEKDICEHCSLVSVGSHHPLMVHHINMCTVALERQISHDGVPEDVGEPFPDEIDAFSIQQSYFDFVPKDVCETLEKEPLNSSSSDSSTIDNVFPQSNSSMSLPITLSPVNCISELMRSDL